jgi:hypothetical protein
MFSYLFMIVASLLTLPVWAEVGHVMFVSGKAQLQTVDGQLVAIAPGHGVDVGQRIITGESGYVHLKMIDNAFYSLRPHSRLLIETYRYRPEQPELNQVKTLLEAGSVRAITGEAGERNKSGYRLNTPVAAIGVRGTDYIVHHEQDLTRVAVSSGEVVVSPFNEQCSRVSYGACSGIGAMSLSANVNGDYIEVKRDQAVPEKKQQGWAIQAQLPNSNGSSTVDNTINQESRSLTNSSTDKLSTPVVYNDKAFHWGRWQDPVTTAKLYDEQWNLMGSNVGYLLLQTADSRPNGFSATPNHVQFNLSEAVAGFRTSSGEWQTAQVSRGGLSVDFKEGAFTTHLAGQYAGGGWQLNAQGAVTPTGAIISNPYKSDAATWVTGGVNQAATQAAYEFDKRLADGAIVGVSYWRAKP